MLLVCLEPEEEAGTVFLRLRKAFRKKGLASWTLAPYLSNGARKMGAQLFPACPATKPNCLSSFTPGTRDARGLAEVSLDENSVILVGERAAGLSGMFSACVGSPSAPVPGWPGYRAGRETAGHFEAGLPAQPASRRPAGGRRRRPGRHPDHLGNRIAAVAWRVATRDEMLISAADAELARWSWPGVDPDDFLDPQAVLEGLEAVDFVISLETRASLVTERADVVFPVSLMHERAGSFVNWEGRRRSFDAVIERAERPCPISGCWRRWPTASAVDLGLPYAGGGPSRTRGAGGLGGRARAAPDYEAGQASRAG